MKTHKSQLEALLKDHYPELAHIQINNVLLYDSDDTPFWRTDPNFKTTWFEDDNSTNEPTGIRIQLFSEQPIPITILANLCNILCYGHHWAIDPAYGAIDPSELPREQDLDTCWHHSQITKLQDINGFHYTIEQGFCTCS